MTMGIQDCVGSDLAKSGNILVIIILHRLRPTLIAISFVFVVDNPRHILRIFLCQELEEDNFRAEVFSNSHY